MLKVILKIESESEDLLNKVCYINALKRLYIADSDKRGLILIIIENRVPVGAFLF